MQRAARALGDNWRLLVLALVVGATSFAGAFVVSSQSSGAGADGTGSGAAQSPRQQPARTPRAGEASAPTHVGSTEEIYAAAVDVVGGEPPAGGGYPEYVQVTSANDVISVEVPVVWTGEESPPWLNNDDEPIGVSVVATPEVTRFYQAWDTPGLFLGASTKIADEGADALLDAGRTFHEQSCIPAGRGEVESDAYVGRYEIWYECGQLPTVVVNVAMHPRDAPDVMIAIYVKVVTPYDLGALERALRTFEVSPEALD